MDPGLEGIELKTAAGRPWSIATDIEEYHE
jgi:hypothetical protein